VYLPNVYGETNETLSLSLSLSLCLSCIENYLQKNIEEEEEEEEEIHAYMVVEPNLNRLYPCFEEIL